MKTCPFCGEMPQRDNTVFGFYCFKCQNDTAKGYYFGYSSSLENHFYIQFKDGGLIVNGWNQLDYIFDIMKASEKLTFPGVERTKEDVLSAFENYQRIKRLQAFA
jgi:hypothetical protein